jgi:predicted transcriptional regulator
MQTNFVTVSPTDTLAHAVELVLAGSQQDFPALENGRLMGMLERDALIKSLAKQGQNEPVESVLRRDLPEVDTHEMVETALARLGESGAKTLPVTHAGRLAGLITSENITEFLMIRSALRAAPGAAD